MPELLTAKDVELVTFKKVSFGGYAIPEVEEFLNQIADDLEAYALRLDERDQRILELEAYVQKQESMTDMIKDALLQARKSAKEMEEQAHLERERILEEARSDAEAQVAAVKARFEDVDSEVRGRLEEADKSAQQLLFEARATAADILREAQEIRQKTQEKWSKLEEEIEAQRKQSSEEIEETLVTARIEARPIIEQSSTELEAYEARLRFLNLKKQQFLRDTVSLLIDFGQMVDKAQQEFELEMEREQGGAEKPIAAP